MYCNLPFTIKHLAKQKKHTFIFQYNFTTNNFQENTYNVNYKVEMEQVFPSHVLPTETSESSTTMTITSLYLYFTPMLLISSGYIYRSIWHFRPTCMSPDPKGLYL